MPAIRNFYKVSETLACAGQPGEAQLQQLAADGYQVIVNLGLHNSIYSLRDEAASVAALGMEYHHIPIIFNQPKLDELLAFIALMNKLEGKKILVHCAANYRASVFTGLYLLHKGELATGELQDFVQDAWQPDAVWQDFLEEGVGYMSK